VSRAGRARSPVTVVSSPRRRRGSTALGERFGVDADDDDVVGKAASD